MIHPVYVTDALNIHVCAEAFPNITAMKEYVASGAGYLQGGLQRENWERGTYI